MSDRRTVTAAFFFSKIGSLGALECNTAGLMVRLCHIQIEAAHHAVGRPWQSHHGRYPGQGPCVALPDAVGGQGQSAHGHHPQQGPDVGHQLLGVLRPLTFRDPDVHALPMNWANR